MKRTTAVSMLCALWVIMLAKTILAMNYHGIDVTVQYYGIMLQNSWQAHFNVDLLIHCSLFACWMVYRAKSKLAGVLCGLGAIYLGAVFTLLYLIAAFVRSGGDLDLFFKGKKSKLPDQVQQFE